MRRAVLAVALGASVVLCLAVVSCTATSGAVGAPGALERPGHRVAARSLSRPQLAMAFVKDTALRSPHASPPFRDVTNLVLVTLGSNRDRVLARMAGFEGPSVAWSPDGRRLAIARYTSPKTTDIFIVNANGSGSHQLTHTGNATNPVWSPDGRTVVFSREGRFYFHVIKNNSVGFEGATASMWSIRPDGSGLRRLTPTVPGQDDEPGSFSPNGKMLAFTRTEPVRYPGSIREPHGVSVLADTSSVYLLNVENGKLTRFARQARHPSFSADGRWLAVSSTRDRNGYYEVGDGWEAFAPDLYLVSLTGNRWRRLTHTEWLPEDFPSFSPNGARITYLNVIENRPGGVFEINGDGTCRTLLRADYDRGLSGFTYYQPSWRPGSQPGPIRCRHA